MNRSAPKEYKNVIAIALVIMLGGVVFGQDAYLFSYFTGNGEDGVHLAYSRDGLRWTALNDNRSFLTPTAGGDKLMRDPCIIKGGDGNFHMVWTVSWNEKGIGYSNSPDLIRWSEQIYIPVMEHEPNARNCWAPELYYDDANQEYLIYWATTIPNRFSETDSTGDDGYNHRMYYTTTQDFDIFGDTKLLYDPGFNVIDATIKKINHIYFMFLKDETRYPKAQKKLRIAKSDRLLGPYSAASEPITGDRWVEGPTITQTGRGWTVYFDQYRLQKMGAITSDNLEDWTDISDEIHFPNGTRHGTVFQVSQEILADLMNQ